MGLVDLPNFGGPTYAQTFPITGLAGLMQGISQGVQLGKQFDLEERKLANEAGWRNLMMQSRSDALAERSRHDQVTENLGGGRLDEQKRANAAREAGQYGDAGAVERAAQKFLSGEMPPQMMSMYGRSPIRQQIIDRVNQLNPKFDWGGAQLGFKEQEYEKGPAAQQRTRTGEAVKPLVDEMRNIVQKSDLSDYPVMNLIGSATNKQMGGTKYTDLEKKAGLIADEIQSMVGVGSDVKLKLIQNIANPTHQGKAQILNGLDNIDLFLKSRVGAFGGDYGKGAGAAKPAAGSGGGPIHTYPSGRKVQWNGQEWAPL